MEEESDGESTGGSIPFEDANGGKESTPADKPVVAGGEANDKKEDENAQNDEEDEDANDEEEDEEV